MLALYLGGGDFFHIQCVIKELGRRKVLLDKILQDLHPHVRIIDLKGKKTVLLMPCCCTAGVTDFLHCVYLQI